MMGKAFGIDFGTTYSAIATFDGRGKPEIIENYADCNSLLASAAYFPEFGDPVIGREAKNQVEIEPDRVVQYIKREIGKSDATPRNFNGVDYDPITISALILKRMKEYAEEQGHEVSDAVLTCPAYFGAEECNAIRCAGQIAGLNVLNVINEPSAAVLSYCCNISLENKMVLVYDLGGCSFDATLLQCISENNIIRPYITHLINDDRMGGVDWDSRLFDYICEQYTDENGMTLDEMDAELRQKIRSQVEDVKKSLSNMPAKSFTINYSGDSTRIEITRDKFVELTQDLVMRTIDLVSQLLNDAAIRADDVDAVLLVGGATRMPMIEEALNRVFPNKVHLNEPELAVAKGAAIYANMESFLPQPPYWGNRKDVKKYFDQLAEVLAFATDVGFTHIAKLLANDFTLSGDDIVRFVLSVRACRDNKFRYARGDCVIPPTFDKYEQVASTIGYCMDNELVDVARKLVSFIPWNQLSQDEVYHYICILTSKDAGVS